MTQSNLQTFCFEGKDVRFVGDALDNAIFDADDVLGIFGLSYDCCPLVLRDKTGFTVEDIVGLKYLSLDDFLSLMGQGKAEEWAKECTAFVEKHILFTQELSHLGNLLAENFFWQGLCSALSQSAHSKDSQEAKEKDIQNRIAADFSGATEVGTPAGRIDVLTDSEVIEVKAAQNWKNAIGQVLAYQTYYPEKTPRVHLFGSKKGIYRVIEDAKYICASLGISLTWEFYSERE